MFGASRFEVHHFVLQEREKIVKHGKTVCALDFDTCVTLHSMRTVIAVGLCRVFRKPSSGGHGKCTRKDM